MEGLGDQRDRRQNLVYTLTVLFRIGLALGQQLQTYILSFISRFISCAIMHSLNRYHLESNASKSRTTGWFNSGRKCYKSNRKCFRKCVQTRREGSGWGIFGLRCI